MENSWRKERPPLCAHDELKSQTDTSMIEYMTVLTFFWKQADTIKHTSDRSSKRFLNRS